MTSPLSVQSCALGCLYGVWCGDAAGAVLEFYRSTITKEMVEEAMHMPGRENKLTPNVSEVGKGQITDDGELTLCLLHAAVEHIQHPNPQLRPSNSDILLHYTPDAKSVSPHDQRLLEIVATYYQKWIKSFPFDVGITTSNALSAVKTATRPTLAEAFTARAREANTTSQANGALMRCSPLAILLGPSPPLSRVRLLTAAESCLSHPTLECQVAEFYYILAINHLIFNCGDREGAIDLVDSTARARLSSTSSPPLSGEKNVLDWLLVDSFDTTGIDCKKSSGWVKWGFILSFYYLRQNSNYSDAIQDTLLKGGDTDTNAAIVGGMIGARWGIVSIPTHMLEPIMKAERPRRERPEFLIPYRETVETEVITILSAVMLHSVQ